MSNAIATHMNHSITTADKIYHISDKSKVSFKAVQFLDKVYDGTLRPEINITVDKTYSASTVPLVKNSNQEIKTERNREEEESETETEEMKTEAYSQPIMSPTSKYFQLINYH